MADKKDFKQHTLVFKALAHPTRLLIIDSLLEEGEKCVSDIQDLLKASQPSVSQHLNILKYTGIVDFRQMGNLRCYFLKDPKKIRALLKSTT